MENKDLKAKYDEMHKQGASAWYGDGREERETILKMGEPWKGLNVLEIGCGEGNLCSLIGTAGANWVTGVDYSEEALKRARSKLTIHNVNIVHNDFHKMKPIKQIDRVVMQGVLEHLDDPFTELKWMMDNLLGENGDVITSSPCFLNPRGIVWMTLDMLGAVMSKTDLHFLHPWEFKAFCENHRYKLTMQDCDWSWGNNGGMIQDLLKRIPLALKDGNLPVNVGITPFIMWLERFMDYDPQDDSRGATMVYKISK